MDLESGSRRIIGVLFFVLLVVAPAGCSGGEPVEEEVDYFDYDTVVLETEPGDIVIRVDREAAPETSRNFLNLCGTGFYDGTYFHRVVPGLLVQGGDPNTRDEDPANDGIGGHTYLGTGTFLEAEESGLKHTRGAVAMARGKSPDTAGSQFFILLDEVPEYDGEYTVFGRVESGMDILSEAAESPGTPRPEGGFQPNEPLVISRSYVRVPE